MIAPESQDVHYLRSFPHTHIRRHRDHFHLCFSIVNYHLPPLFVVPSPLPACTKRFASFLFCCVCACVCLYWFLRFELKTCTAPTTLSLCGILQKDYFVLVEYLRVVVCRSNRPQRSSLSLHLCYTFHASFFLRTPQKECLSPL